MSSSLRPERVAAAARALGSELSERVTLYADALSSALLHELGLVAWDREQLIGGLQARLERLRQRRFRDYGGSGVRVIERRRQPLESIDLIWSELRQGRRVQMEFEHGACSAVIELMRGMARALQDVAGEPPLLVHEQPWIAQPPDPSASATAMRLGLEHPDQPSLWPLVGPIEPRHRVAVIESQADRELAAYVLARTSLRRTGMDPRSVKHAHVVQVDERLERYLGRLWIEVQMGPASSSDSFAGPVSTEVRDEFMEANEVWNLHPDVTTLSPGGELELGPPLRDRHFLAPALFAVDWPVPDLPLAGPMLVVIRCTPEQARAGAEAAAREGGQVIVIGGHPSRYPGDVRFVQGALLVERLPPGLPDPRPV